MAKNIAERLKLMKAKYEEWVATGVPEGIDFKTSLSGAHGWSCPEHGIHAVGSKRDWNTEHAKYGTLVSEIGELLSRLRSVDEMNVSAEATEEPGEERRVYTTQLARRLASEAKLEESNKRLAAVVKNYHKAKYALEIKDQELSTLFLRTADLKMENAQLKQSLAQHQKILKAVE